jgi:hypothetical protein
MTAAQRRAWALLQGDPEYEAMKAACRPLSHAAAVREAAFLSEQYRRVWRSGSKAMIELAAVVRQLRLKKIPFVLTGAHGIAGWTGRPRSTHDIDILVKSGRNHARAVKAIRELYPHLEVRPLRWLTAFFVPGEKESVIDVTFSHRPDNAVTLETGIWVEEHGTRYRVPSLEAALANKYGAMLTPTRDAVKRGQDGVDFATMVRHSLNEGRSPIDLEQLAALGEMVWPGGGGAEILKLVAEAKTGKVPNLMPLAGHDKRQRD